MSDLMVAILEKIHDALNGLRSDTNTRFEALESELHLLRVESGERFVALEQRLGQLAQVQSEGEIRVSTELIAVADGIRQLIELSKAQFKPKLEEHEARLDRIEEHLGLGS